MAVGECPWHYRHLTCQDQWSYLSGSIAIFSERRYLFSSGKKKNRADIELVSAFYWRKYETLWDVEEHSDWPSLIHFLLIYFAYLFFPRASLFLSIQLGINYVCCCKFSLFTAGSGPRGTVPHTQGHSVETAANRGMSPTLQHICYSGFYNERMVLDIPASHCLPVPLCPPSVCLSFSVTHFG